MKPKDKAVEKGKKFIEDSGILLLASDVPNYNRDTILKALQITAKEKEKEMINIEKRILLTTGAIKSLQKENEKLKSIVKGIQGYSK